MPLRVGHPSVPRTTPLLPGEDGCILSLSVIPAKAGTQLSTWSARPMTSSTSDPVLPSTVVIPAKAGISLLLTKRRKQREIPASAGMTEEVRQSAISPPDRPIRADLRDSGLSGFGRECGPGEIDHFLPLR